MGEAVEDFASLWCYTSSSMPIAAPPPTDLMTGVLQLMDHYRAVNYLFWIPSIFDLDTAGNFCSRQGFDIDVIQKTHA